MLPNAGKRGSWPHMGGVYRAPRSRGAPGMADGRSSDRAAPRAGVLGPDPT